MGNSTFYTSSTYNEHKAKLRQAASATKCGSRRAEVEDAMSRILDEPAFTIKVGKTTAVVTGLGVEYAELAIENVEVDDENSISYTLPFDKAKVMRPGYIHTNLRSDLPGAAFANKRVRDWVIPCGVVLIVASGGKGKTPLAHALAAIHHSEVDHAYGVVRMGEPFTGYSDENVALSLGEAMANHSDVVFDSIKDILSSTDGGAMKSGLSRGAITAISAWSSMACELGCTIYIPVNPSSDDKEVFDMMVEIAKSNATATIIDAGNDIWEYSSRTGEGLERVGGRLKVVYDKGDVIIKNASDVDKVGPESEFSMKFKASIEDHALAMSRVVSQRSNF